MKIINSLKNDNNKRFLVLSICLTLVVAITCIILIINDFQNKKIDIIGKFDIANTLAIEELQTNLYTSIGILLGIFLLLIIVITIIYIIALGKNEAEAKSIRNYLEKLMNSDYKLELDNCSESEISNLKSELYKSVLMLKEKAEILDNDRKALATYMEDISHQLRTPLMAISVLFDEALANDVSMDVTTRKNIYEISRQLDQMNWLVTSLLKLAKLDTDAVLFKKEKINVKDIFSNAKSNLNIFLEMKNQKLEIENKDITIVIDKLWFTEAIENILKNCIENSPENTIISVKFEENTIYTIIDIEDQGNGIDKEDIQHIFDRFYKGKNSNSNSFGIGLSLSKSIIEKHGGEIKVESKIGKGSRFIIKLYK